MDETEDDDTDGPMVVEFGLVGQKMAHSVGFRKNGAKFIAGRNAEAYGDDEDGDEVVEEDPIVFDRVSR